MAKLTSFPSTGCCNSTDKRLLDFLIERNNGKSVKLEGRKSVGWNNNSYWPVANIDNSTKPRYELKDLLPFLGDNSDISKFQPFKIHDEIEIGTRVIAIKNDSVDDDYLVGDKGLVTRDIRDSIVEVKFDKDIEPKTAFKYHLALLPEHEEEALVDEDSESVEIKNINYMGYTPLKEKPRKNKRVICLQDSTSSNEYKCGWIGTVMEDNEAAPTVNWDNGIKSIVYYTNLAYVTLKTHNMMNGEVYMLKDSDGFWLLFKVNDNSLVPNTDEETIKSVSGINSRGKYRHDSVLPIRNRTINKATNFQRDWVEHCIEKGEFVSEVDYGRINIEQREINELIDKAHDKYPIGTYVKSLFHTNNPILKITSEVFSYYAEQKRVAGIGETSFLPVVYLDGKWAEIVDEREFKAEQLLIEAKRRYPVGSKVCPAHLGKGPYYMIITEDCIFKATDYDVVSYLPNFNISSNDSKYGNSSNARFIYSDGKWAELYEEPTEFIRGKWYIGFHRIENFIFKFDDQKDNRFYYSDMENIISRGVHLRHGNFLYSGNDKVREVTQEELDKYLEDGHPDKTWEPKVGENAVMVAAGGWGYHPDDDGCIATITEVFKSSYETRKYEISGYLLNPTVRNRPPGRVIFDHVPIFRDNGTVVCRKATIDDMLKIVAKPMTFNPTSFEPLFDASGSMAEKKSTFADVKCNITSREPREDEIITMAVQKNRYTPTLDLSSPKSKKVKKPVLDFNDDSFKNMPFNRPLDLNIKKEKKKKINLVL